MSTVPPGPYPQSGSPAGMPSSASSPKKVSSAGYWIALTIFVLGCGAAAVWFIVVIVGALTAPEDYARTDVGDSMEVQIDTGDWVLYHEGPGAGGSGTGGSEPQVDVYDPTGSAVLLRTPDSTSYSTSDHEGHSLYEFTARTEGVYTIDTFGEANRLEQVALGRPYFEDAIAGILGSIALGSICFLVALVLLIVTIVRRSKSKKALAASPYRPAPAVPGAPGSFAAPIPTSPMAPRPPVPPGPPPAPGTYGGPVVPPPPTPTSPYTPGWAAPTPEPAPVPPPPAATGFAAPGGTSSPFEPPVPEPPVAEPPEPPVPEPPAAEAPESDETERTPTDEAWDKPGEF